MPYDLSERASRTEEVVAKWRNKPFDWRTTGTCLHLARAQMRALGHNPPTIPRFQSAMGAMKALRSAGYDDMEAMMDSLLPRIAPAASWVGDIVMLAGEPPFDSLCIQAGGALLGYHQDAEALAPIVNAVPKAAWRL